MLGRLKLFNVHCLRFPVVMNISWACYCADCWCSFNKRRFVTGFKPAPVQFGFKLRFNTQSIIKSDSKAQPSSPDTYEIISDNHKLISSGIICAAFWDQFVHQNRINIINGCVVAMKWISKCAGRQIPNFMCDRLSWNEKHFVALYLVRWNFMSR